MERARSESHPQVTLCCSDRSFAGASISLALGGSITTKTGNPLIVFYIAVAIMTSTFIYVVFVLPETFPEDKRKPVSCMRSESPVDKIPKATGLSSIFLVFEPLKMLIPTRSLGKNHNWRLTWCAAHSFVFVTAHPHSSSAWFVLITSKFHLTPADVSTGLHQSSSAQERNSTFRTIQSICCTSYLGCLYRDFKRG